MFFLVAKSVTSAFAAKNRSTASLAKSLLLEERVFATAELHGEFLV